jgi:hypothetical protein
MNIWFKGLVGSLHKLSGSIHRKFEESSTNSANMLRKLHVFESLKLLINHPSYKTLIEYLIPTITYNNAYNFK